MAEVIAHVTIDATMLNEVLRTLRGMIENDRDACRRQAERAATIGRASEDATRWETIERTWHAQADALTRTLDLIDRNSEEPGLDPQSSSSSGKRGPRRE